MAAARKNRRRKPALTERLRAASASMLRGLRPGVALLAVVLMLFITHRTVVALRAVPVDRIVVSGKLEHLRQEALRGAVAEHLNDGLLFLDLSLIRRDLESLPWVYRAQLRRRFPDTLEIHVVEQLPIARWGEGGFLNHEARVITVVDEERWNDLPTVRGPMGSEARLMNRYQRLDAQLRKLELRPVEVHEDDFGQLQVRLDNGVLLQLGNKDFADRLQSFLHLWRREFRGSPDGVRAVDMRYDGGAAVAMDEPALVELQAGI